MGSRLTLDRISAIGGGKARLIFEHPRHADRILKVVRPRQRERAARSLSRYSLSGQFGANKVFVKEVQYFLAIEARHPHLLPLFPWVHGFVMTNLGLAVAQEKIADGRGGLAPSLARLAEEGAFTGRHRALACALLDRIAREHIVVHDLNPGNIVAEGPRDRPRRLVIVDGFGDPGVPPLRRLWPWYNRLTQRPALGALRKRLGL